MNETRGSSPPQSCLLPHQIWKGLQRYGTAQREIRSQARVRQQALSELACLPVRPRLVPLDPEIETKGKQKRAAKLMHLGQQGWKADAGHRRSKIKRRHE